jgi:GxxExxY protein
MKYNELSHLVLEVAIDVHRRLGPGLLESVYQTILAHELIKRGLTVEKEVPIPLHWDNLHFEIGFRADLIVNDLILVELKSVEELNPVHKKIGSSG